MDLIDAYYEPETIDCYTFVFGERNPQTGHYTMLATSETGRSFSQWTEGRYDPRGSNEHLGERVAFWHIGRTLLSHVFARMAEDE